MLSFDDHNIPKTSLYRMVAVHSMWPVNLATQM